MRIKFYFGMSVLCMLPTVAAAQTFPLKSECSYEAQLSYVVGVLVGLVAIQKSKDICLPATEDISNAIARAVEKDRLEGKDTTILDGPTQVNIDLAFGFLKRNFPCK